MGLITLLPLTGLTLYLARVLRIPHAAAVLQAVSIIVLTLFVGGLLGLLWWAAISIHFVGIALLLHEPIRARIQFQPAALPLTYGLLAVFSISFWLVHGNSQFLYYDEYSHWGVFVQEMLALDGFWHSDTNALHPRYPPALPLWQYLFNVFQEPSEGRIYLAQFVFLMAPLLVLWNKLGWQRLPWVLGISALCLLGLANFGHGVSSLYADHVLGTWFAGIILTFLASEKRSLGGLLAHAPAIAVIALVKGPGLWFALAASVILAAVYVYRSGRDWKLSRYLPQGALAVAILAGPMFAAVEAWSLNRDSVGAGSDLEPLGRIVASVSDSGMARTTTDAAVINERFLEMLLHQQISKDEISRQLNAFTYPARALFVDRFRLTTFSFVLIYMAFCLAIWRFVLQGHSRSLWAVVQIGVLSTALGYLSSLYLTYRFAADLQPAMLSSYIRYAHSIILPMLLIAFAPLTPAFSGGDKPKTFSLVKREIPRHAAIFCFALTALYALETPYLGHMASPNAPLELRRQLEPFTAALREEAAGSSIWVHLPTDQANRFGGELMQYLLTPSKVTIARTVDFWNKSDREIADVWTRYEYVWIPYEPSPAIAEQLARFVTGPSDSGVFRIGDAAGGSIQLQPIVLSGRG